MSRQPQTGGLRLPKDVGVAASFAEAIEHAWSTIQKVNARMASRGLDENPEPDVECPVVTAELLISPGFVEYSTAFSAQLRWYNYVAVLLADVRSIILEIDNAQEDIASSKRLAFKAANELKAKNDRMSEKEMADHIFQDPHYKDLSLQKQILEQERIKLDARSDTLERNMKTISRQIENRKLEATGGARENNIPAHQSGRWEPRRD